MTSCAVCGRPCERELEPAFGGVPAVMAPDVWQVVFRNRIAFPACVSCWGAWPDEWKRYPAEGFGRSRERVDDLVRVLQETTR